ncbi:MAG: hypothetical protein ACLQU2_34070, partial [Candidatus Binataceae bacterium]
RRVIARASRCTRRSIFSIVRPYSTARTSLNVYAPDISYVYDTNAPTWLPAPFGCASVTTHQEITQPP